MANLIKCDGCDAISPNPKTGLYDANNWLHVILEQRNKFFKPTGNLIYCDQCTKNILGVLKVTC